MSLYSRLFDWWSQQEARLERDNSEEQFTRWINSLTNCELLLEISEMLYAMECEK